MGQVENRLKHVRDWVGIYETDVTVIVIPHSVDNDVAVVNDGTMVICKNTVGEIELVRILRKALTKRMNDRNAKQVQRPSVEG